MMHKIYSKYGLHSFRSGGATKAANADIMANLLNAVNVGEVKMLKMATYRTREQTF